MSSLLVCLAKYLHCTPSPPFPPTSCRPSIHLFGDTVTTSGALEQSADSCGIHCSSAFLAALSHGRDTLPCEAKEAAPLTEGPTAGQPTYNLF